MTPIRIQRQRTKGWRMPPDTVYVGRPTLWGNPWALRDAVTWEIPPSLRRLWAVERYRDELKHWGLMSDYGWYTSDAHWDEVDQAIQESGAKNMAEYVPHALRGKNLACWCPLEDEQGNRVPCHADVLLELANSEAGMGRHG